LKNKLQHQAITYCEIPKMGLSQTMNALKKGLELRYISSPSKLSFAAASLLVNITKIEKQNLLEIDDLKKRMETVSELMRKEIDQLKKNQTDFEKQGGTIIPKVTTTTVPHRQGPHQNPPPSFNQFNRNPMGGGGGAAASEVDQLRKQLQELPLSEEAQKIVEGELKKLSRMPSHNQEYHVILSYLQNIAALPWGKLDPDNNEPGKAQEILDRDHFGLDQVKKRIIQYLAVRKLNNNNAPTILCFYGPPGVGKTSLGKSIAESMNRKFYRISLGGVNDES